MSSRNIYKKAFIEGTNTNYVILEVQPIGFERLVDEATSPGYQQYTGNVELLYYSTTTIDRINSAQSECRRREYERKCDNFIKTRVAYEIIQDTAKQIESENLYKAERNAIETKFPYYTYS